jgi:SAM-dependent methyltransferase
MTDRICCTEPAALERRIAAHERFGARDLAPWILEHLQPVPGLEVLELGCGTGQQTLPVARAIGDTGRVLAVDASSEALARLRTSAGAARIGARIELLRGDFDDLARRSCNRSFDRVLSCYALYYARAPASVLRAVHSVLRPGGILFYCGPGRGNNAELKRLHRSIPGAHAEEEDPPTRFMEEEGPGIAAELFGAVERSTFENPLRFDSAEALHSYWSAYFLYDPQLEPGFEAAARNHFERNATFTTVKRVVGIRATK